MCLLVPFAPGPRCLFRTTRRPGRNRPWLASPVAETSLRRAWNTNAPSTLSVVTKRTEGELPIAYRPQNRVYGASPAAACCTVDWRFKEGGRQLADMIMMMMRVKKMIKPFTFFFLAFNVPLLRKGGPKSFHSQHYVIKIQLAV